MHQEIVEEITGQYVRSSNTELLKHLVDFIYQDFLNIHILFSQLLIIVLSSMPSARSYNYQKMLIN